MDLGRCIRARHVGFFARNACGCVEKEPEMAGDLAFPKTAAPSKPSITPPSLSISDAAVLFAGKEPIFLGVSFCSHF